MKFVVINRDGRPVMSTTTVSCLPTKEQIISMLKAGYKFKIDGKTATKKAVEELRNTKNNQ